MPIPFLLMGCIMVLVSASNDVVSPEMYYADTDHGRPFAKDPDVVRFKGRCLLYYSMRPDPRLGIVGFRIADETGETQRRHVPRLGQSDPMRGGYVTGFLGGGHALRMTMLVATSPPRPSSVNPSILQST